MYRWCGDIPLGVWFSLTANWGPDIWREGDESSEGSIWCTLAHRAGRYTGQSLSCWIYFRKHINKSIFSVCHSLILRWFWYLPSYLMEDQHTYILPSQCHGCWWPDNARSQGPVLLTLLRHVARILANGSAAFFESCDATGWNSCDVSQKTLVIQGPV